MIYLDNAATSYPKPRQVIRAVDKCLAHFSANPGRSGHTPGAKADRVLYGARISASQFLRAKETDVFFTLNCTDSLCCAINGVLRRGDHVITTIWEHNSVLRPLEHLKKQGLITYDCVLPDKNGNITPELLDRARRSSTRMVICSHVSNVTGIQQNAALLYDYCKKHGLLFCLDAAQSAGYIPLNAEMADIICIPGHKGLLGPMGCGLIYITPRIELTPLRMGGTGSQSESLNQPAFRPDRYESGTLPLPAIAGMAAGIELINKKGTEIAKREKALTVRLHRGLSSINGIKLLSAEDSSAGIVLFNYKHADSRQISRLLDLRFGIATRAGYHCAPLAHRYLGTLEQGAVRISIGYANTQSDIDAAIHAVSAIAKKL